MANVPNRPASINVPSDALFLLRNKLIEACALSSTVADEIGALPPEAVSEPVQALANLSERINQEAFAAFEALALDPALVSA